MDRITDMTVLDLEYVNRNREDYGQFTFFQSVIANRDDDDYVAFCHKEPGGYMKQELLPVKKVREVLTHARMKASGNDLFITPNSFASGNNRRNANVAHFNACFVDLDFHKTKKYPKVTPEKVAKAVLSRCGEIKMPLPSFIVATGNGLHCWWLFSAPLANTYSRVWNAVQESICDAFAEFGADCAAKDAARILRIPGTFNGKDEDHAALVKTIYEKSGDRTVSAQRMYQWAAERKEAMFYIWLRNQHSKELGALHIFQIKSMVDNGRFVLGKNEEFIPYIPFEPDSKIPVLKSEQPKITRQLRGETAEACSARHRAAALSVRANRIRDIEALAALRGYNVTGHRDLLLYHYVQFMRGNGYSFPEQERAATALNARFTEPLPDKEVQSILHENSLMYDPSNECLIRKLGITEQEQMQMLTIYGRHEKERRRIENSKTGMSRDERTTYMCASILEYLSNGLGAPEIAEKLRCTRQCVNRYIRAYGLNAKALASCTRGTQRQGEASRKERAKRAKEYARKTVKKLRKDAGADTELKKAKHLSKKEYKAVADGMRRIIRSVGDEFWNKFCEFIRDFEKRNGVRLFTINGRGKMTATPVFEKLLFRLSAASGGVRYGKPHENGVFVPPLLPVLADAA